MQLTQSKSIEILFTTLIFIGLFATALHAKDIFTPKFQKFSKDDSGAAIRKVVDDSHNHNHTDKFSFKAAKIAAPHTFTADSRSLKKQFVSNKRLQKILD